MEKERYMQMEINEEEEEEEMGEGRGDGASTQAWRVTRDAKGDPGHSRSACRHFGRDFGYYAISGTVIFFFACVVDVKSTRHACQ